MYLTIQAIHNRIMALHICFLPDPLLAGYHLLNISFIGIAWLFMLEKHSGVFSRYRISSQFMDRFTPP